jgi:hypothetical protein
MATRPAAHNVDQHRNHDQSVPSCYGASQAASNGAASNEAASNEAASNEAASNGAVSNGAGLTGLRDCCSAAQAWTGGQAGDIARAALVLTHFEHGDVT